LRPPRPVSTTEREGRSAFSLLELIVILIILAMISAVAVPRVAHAHAEQRVSAAARRLAADLTMAQRQARFTASSQTIVVDTTLNRYELSNFAHPDRPSGAYEVALGSEPYIVDVTSVDFGGDATLVFNGFGRPDSAGQVVLTVGSHGRVVIVDGTSGKVTIASYEPLPPGEEPPVLEM